MGSTTATEVIQFGCPHCRRTNRVPAKYAGQRGRCPGCRKPIRVPEDSADDLEDEGAEEDDDLDDEQLEEYMELASSRIDHGEKRQEVYDHLLRSGLSRGTADEILKTVIHKANRDQGQSMIMEGVCGLVLGLVLMFYFPAIVFWVIGIGILLGGLARACMGAFQLTTGVRMT